MEKFLTSEGASILYNDLKNTITRIDNNLSPQMAQKIDGAFVSDDGKYLHLTANGLDFIGPLGPFSGGGGGGGGGSDNNAKLTVTNWTKWGRTVSIATSSTCSVDIEWDSLEDGVPTGNGVLTLRRGTEVLRTTNIAQGRFQLDVTGYLQMGSNTIYVSIADVYNNTRTLSFSISVTAYSLESTTNTSEAYSGNINFTFSAYGEAVKTMHFILDGEEVGTKEVAASGRSEVFVISQAMWKTHGTHEFEAYFTANVNGSDLVSNRLHYEFICAVPGNMDPIIASTFTRTTVQRYETINIPFLIYNPASLVSTLTLTINGKSEIRENVPGNSWQTWSYRVMDTAPLTMTITLGSVSRTFNLTVNGSIIPISAVEDSSLSLYLTSSGRDNLADDKDIWEYGDIRANFSGFNWTSDGWLADSDGYTALTLKGDARVNIPYQIFKTDFRSSGKTIEIEFSTSDVNDYTAPIINCMDGNRGLIITAQDMIFKSAQTTVQTQFKEDEHVRITFVVDSTATDRLILCYINAVLSGLDQYPANDNFEQTNPVNLIIGSNDVTTQVYNIRVYDRALSRFEILNNWICDKQNAEDMLAAYEHNNIFDTNDATKGLGLIQMNKLPRDLPYMVIYPERVDGTHTLPQSKSDKIPCSGYYVDPSDSSKNFTFIEAEAAVQGTSSAIYPRKNYKIKFKKDKDPLKRPNFKWYATETGASISKWAMNEQAIPTNTFTFKADFASSEGANNVELVRLYNDLGKNICKTPPQTYGPDDTDEEKAKKDKIRVGIDGFPILIFYNNGQTTTFLGKYNFNNDKGTENVYGFDEGDQSWEITSNVSALANWQSDDLSPIDKPLKWTEAFEARYPDDGDEADISDLQVFSTWLASTARGTIHEQQIDPVTGDDILIDTGIPVWADRSKTEIDPETGEPIYHGVDLDEEVTYQVPKYDEDGKITGYDDVTYTEDNADYRLAKFYNEAADHLNLNSAYLYYLFTELFLLVDSRAKNAFPTKFSEDDKWCWIPYDMDTALGINNEGKLVFGYSLEDTDHIEGGADVYNGQYSTMWCNLRDAFPRELKETYHTLVSNGLNYETVEKRFEDHQSKWPEAVFNEDAYFKYIEPFLEEAAPYLEMCLGSKAEQRKWWLYNRFRYMDSKYVTGEAEKAQIKFRAYSNGPLNIVPYADIYARFRMGGKNESPAAAARAFKNEVCTLNVNPGDNVNDLDCYIFSADQLKDVGDMSVFTPDTCDFSAAIKLQRLKIGRATPNLNLKSLILGKNVLLKNINVINCPNLPKLDIPDCTNLEELYLEGCTSLTSVDLPQGGMMTTLHLPANMTNLTIKNQPKITDFQLEGASHIDTLWFENVSPVIASQTLTLLEGLTTGARVRLWNFEESFSTVADFKEFINQLDRMKGINGNLGNEELAQILGTATITSDEELDYEYYADVRRPKDETHTARYTNLEIMCNLKKTVRFHNWDGTVLDTRYVTTRTGVDGEVTYFGVAPTRTDPAAVPTTYYVWRGWATSQGGPLTDFDKYQISHVDKSYDLYAYFEEIPIYTVNFYNYNGIGITLLDTQTTRPDLGAYVDYAGPTPTPPSGFEGANFLGWGTSAYNGVDIESDGVRINNITESMNLVAQMDWQVIADSIAVTGNYKRYYFPYEVFDPANLQVTIQKATPQGAQTSQVRDFSYTQTRLTIDSTSVTITADSLNTTTIPVYMAQSMEIISDPEKYFQFTNQVLDLTGMAVRITFSDNTTLEDSDITHLKYMVPGVDPESPQVISTEGYATIRVLYANPLCDLECNYEVLVLTQIYDTLEDNTWPAISAIVDTNRVPQAWHIGDTKTVYIEDSEYSGEYTFRILGIDHNIDQEAPRQNGAKVYEHSLTFGLAQLKKLDVPRITDMREVAIEWCYPHTQNSSEAYQGWTKSWHFGNEMRTTCNRIFNSLPADLQRCIKPVIKGQADIAAIERPDLPTNTYQHSNAIQTQEDYVYIPSVYELTGENFLTDDSEDWRERLNVLESSVCQRFQYYQEIAPRAVDRIKYSYNAQVNITPTTYWTRTWLYIWRPDQVTYYYYAMINSSGQPARYNATNPANMLFCFTI